MARVDDEREVRVVRDHCRLGSRHLPVAPAQFVQRLMAGHDQQPIASVLRTLERPWFLGEQK